MKEKVQENRIELVLLGKISMNSINEYQNTFLESKLNQLKEYQQDFSVQQLYLNHLLICLLNKYVNEWKKKKFPFGFYPKF
jgi:hypothetical protein